MVTTLGIGVRSVLLALRLHAAVPDLSPAEAYAQAADAQHAATPTLRPELLLAVAYVESRFDPTAMSRVEDGIRRGGSVPGAHPPPRLDRRGAMFCGLHQTRARTWRECVALRDPATSYARAVGQLEAWIADRRVAGSLPRALAGYACGNHGVRTGRCNRYPARVLWAARRISTGTAPRAARRLPGPGT